MSTISERYTFIQKVAREAGTLAYDYYIKRDELITESKGVQDFVSIADKNVETFIRDHIKKHFPNDAILGEEHGIEGDPSQGIWIIDPIDGTSNFLKGVEMWCVTIAWMIDGDTKIGITYNPMTDKLYHAMLGHGAFINSDKIELDANASMAGATVVFGGFRGRFDDSLTIMKSLHEQNIEYRRFGSAAIALALVAEGIMEGYIEFNLNTWDALGGLLIVKEAKGFTYQNWNEHNLQTREHVIACSTALSNILSEHLS